MSEPDSAYPLVEPSEIEVSAIESQLEEIWRSSAEAEGGNAVMRAAAFTLIYAVRGSAQDGVHRDLLVELTLRHPARAILLCLDEHSTASPIRSWVSVYCHRSSPSSSPVCNDIITLEATGLDCSAVVSTLLSLFISGLPTVLIWDNSMPSDHPILLELGPQLERVIVSAIPPCAPASKLSTLFRLTDALGEKPVVTDLCECFVQPWQAGVARLFDNAVSDVPLIREVRIGYGGNKIPVELLLLAAWLSVILKWKASRITLHGQSPNIVFDQDRTITFSGNPSDPNADQFVEFHFAGNDKVMRCEEPMGENRVVELIHLQLQIWGRDPVRYESLRRARLWLKELLFS